MDNNYDFTTVGGKVSKQHQQKMKSNFGDERNSFQQWDNEVWTRKEPTGKNMRSQQALATAQRNGTCINTTHRSNTGSNDGRFDYKLDQATEVAKPKTTGHEFSQALITARVAKKWKRGDLAKAVNINIKVIDELETCKYIVDVKTGALINKLNRSLGVTLPKLAHKS
jgi:ribosome-binding protein aMBF1 (putative translation factor)